MVLRDLTVTEDCDVRAVAVVAPETKDSADTLGAEQRATGTPCPGSKAAATNADSWKEI